jgi:hypothetical protein
VSEEHLRVRRTALGREDQPVSVRGEAVQEFMSLVLARMRRATPPLAGTM